MMFSTSRWASVSNTSATDVSPRHQSFVSFHCERSPALAGASWPVISFPGDDPLWLRHYFRAKDEVKSSVDAGPLCLAANLNSKSSLQGNMH